MKKLWLRFQSVDKILSILFIVCLIFIFLYQLILTKHSPPSWFENAYELGLISYRLCLSYVASFIFYFLNIHLKNFKLKVNTVKYVDNKIRKIKEMNHIMQNKLIENSETHSDEVAPLTKETVIKCCKQIEMHETFAINLKEGQLVFASGWLEYFDFLREETNRHTFNLFELANVLDYELIKILTKLDDHLEENFNHNRVDLPSSFSQDLSQFSESILIYNDLISEIEEYSKSLKIYKKEADLHGL